MDIELAKEKKIIEEDSSLTQYNKLENFYKYLFENYLLRHVNIKKYDEKIENSNLYFSTHKPEQLISGLNEYLNLNYIFVLNNFFIEKLSDEDLVFLKNELLKNENEFTDEMDIFIKRTYKEIITKDKKDDSSIKSYKICYGPAIPSNFALNNALVLKIFYGKNIKTLSDEEFLQNLKNQRNILNTLKNNMEEELSSTLDIPVTVMYEKF